MKILFYCVNNYYFYSIHINMLENKDIISEYFDHEHYMRVSGAREAANEKAGKVIYPMFEDLYPENGRIFGHELEGCKIHDKIGHRYVTIESVHKHWYHGWYYVILYYREYEHFGEIHKSHGTLTYKNINCTDKTILECIRHANERYDLTDILR